MNRDPYRGFAGRYDRFYGGFDQHDAGGAGFFRALFREHGVRRVLDCACGTGRDLHLFHTLGLDVTGADLSGSMLDQARENLGGCGLQVPLVQADYRALPLPSGGRFDAVACLSSSILHMPDEAQAVRAFRSMRRVLRDGGLLVLTQGTTDRQWAEKPRFLLAVNTPDFSRLFVIDYLERGARYNILDIFHGEEGGGLEVWSVEYAHMLLRDDQERLLRAAGFADLAFYGSYDFAPYDRETSRLLIAVARR